MRLVLPIVAAAIILPLILLFAMSSGTTLRIDPPVKAIGLSTPVKVHLENPHGVRRISAFVEQNGQRAKLFDTSFPSRRVMFFGAKHEPRDVTFTAGKNEAQFLKDGKARLIVETDSNDFRGATDSTSADVDVITSPPRVAADGAQHYINQGGMELVTFTVSGYWTEAGVRVGKYTFRSFPLPGKSTNERFSMFAYPWDLPPTGVEPVVYARNPAGNEAVAHFWNKIFPKKYRVRDFDITDSVMQRLVDNIEPNGTGDLLQRFLRINGEMRKQNNQTLADLRSKTEEKILWHGPFIHYGQEEAAFADTRNYIYHGKKVDQQTHLGFDLADKANSPVGVANDGKVIFTENLGIYGNCVVIDHGYGLQSLYGHNHSFSVKVGDMVKKGQEIAKSDSTGLALGDHVHFGMMIDGVQITPVEWWDEHWIKDRILSKLGVSQ